MDRIFRGILRYIKTDREKMVEQFITVRNNPETEWVMSGDDESLESFTVTRFAESQLVDTPDGTRPESVLPPLTYTFENEYRGIFVENGEPKAIFFTCMDSRMIPTRFTETNVGDMFIVRNAGNIIPHSQHFLDEPTTNEPAALELGCVVNDIRHIIVCGHSDCKAMNLLYRLRDIDFASKDNRRISPLRAWLCTHAMSSLDKYQQLEVSGFDSPLVFQSETPMRKVIAYIDPEHKFTIEDKLSQVNCLQQMQNIASYGFLKKRLESHNLHIHALWFDIYTGDIYYFSRQNKRFVEINERSLDMLTDEVNKYYS